MTPADIDEALTRLTQTLERVGSNLVDLELDPTRELLDELPLEGQSAAIWQQARTSVAELWHLHGLLVKHLDRAREARGTRSRPRADQVEELSELLAGRSIELTTRSVPLTERDLAGADEVVERCTFDELLARMSRAFDETKAVVARFANAWDTLSRRVRAAQQHVSESAELASSLGEPAGDELERVRVQLDALQQLLARDPLSVGVADVEAVEASLRAVRSSLDDLERLRRDVGRRLDESRALLGEVERWLRSASEARDKSMSRIAGVVISEVPAGVPELAQELAEVEHLVRAGSWRPAGDALAAWTRRAVSLRDQGKSITATSLAPLDERNELRGRLDGYVAKAAKLGLLEDVELSALHDDVRDELYTAPTDLGRARSLMSGFQRALVERRLRAELRR